jgi:hypothetical protein
MPAGMVSPRREYTQAELAAVLRLLAALRPRIGSINIGSSRDPISLATAVAVQEAWTSAGGQVLDVVDWPDDAASWLRQARRFTVHEPDAWVVTGSIWGWVQMGRRLAYSTDWDPARTVATASLADATLIAAGGIGTFDGLRGVHRDGRSWHITRTSWAVGSS